MWIPLWGWRWKTAQFYGISFRCWNPAQTHFMEEGKWRELFNIVINTTQHEHQAAVFTYFICKTIIETYVSMIHWLILTECLPVWDYFIPRGLGIVYIVCLYLYFLCNFLSFLHRVIWYQVFLSNTNNLLTVLFARRRVTMA